LTTDFPGDIINMYDKYLTGCEQNQQGRLRSRENAAYPRGMSFCKAFGARTLCAPWEPRPISGVFRVKESREKEALVRACFIWVVPRNAGFRPLWDGIFFIFREKHPVR
jgi:hypothetical protein